MAFWGLHFSFLPSLNILALHILHESLNVMRENTQSKKLTKSKPPLEKILYSDQFYV